MYIGKVEKKTRILTQRPYMPSGSSRITSTRIRPKMPASTPGFLRKLPMPSPMMAISLMFDGRGGVVHAGRDRIAQDGDQRRQEGHEDRAEHRAVQRAQPAHDHQQQELDRQQDGEDVGRQIGDLVGEQRAGEAHQRGRIGEGDRLVDREVDAHRLGGDLAVADGDPGAAGGRAQQVARQPQHQHQEEQAEIVERPLVVRTATPKIVGLSTGMPAKPCVTDSQRLNTSWMITAKASVAMVR